MDNSSSEELIVNGVEEIVKESLEGDLPPLAIIALRLKVSDSTIKRYFKRIKGSSIYSYYIKQKMAHAEKLMTEGSVSRIGVLAKRLGYESQVQFSIMYKKIRGVTPSEHLKRVRAGLLLTES